jgi:DNA-binding transcriptional MerR regulator
MSEVAPGHGVYPISVASELSGVDPQMLRVYEQRGLLTPFRTDGGTRRYSREDLDRIADITALLDEGLNLAGIGHVLQLRARTDELTTELGELHAANEPDRRELRRLRRENTALKAELVRLDDEAATADEPSAPDTPGARGARRTRRSGA